MAIIYHHQKSRMRIEAVYIIIYMNVWECVPWILQLLLNGINLVLIYTNEISRRGNDTVSIGISFIYFKDKQTCSSTVATFSVIVTFMILPFYRSGITFSPQMTFWCDLCRVRVVKQQLTLIIMFSWFFLRKRNLLYICSQIKQAL